MSRTRDTPYPPAERMRLAKPARLLRGQPLVSALAAASAVVVVLALVVLAPLWLPTSPERPVTAGGAAISANRSEQPAELAAPTEPPDPTSTPWPRRTRTPAPIAASDESESEERRPTATATARPTKTPRPSPTPTATPEPALYRADADEGLDGWNGPNWTLDDGMLVNDGSGVDAHRWLAAPEAAPVDGPYAVEFEVQIVGVARGYCEQNFGVVAESSGGVFVGGGIIYFCDGGDPVARITDVSDWSNGYNRDPVLNSTRLNPGTGWHTFRLEIEPNRVRFLIDGKVVVEVSGQPSGEAGPDSASIGIWSQGVNLVVRQVVVEPLAIG